MSGMNSPTQLTEAAVSSLVTRLLFTLLLIHIKLPSWLTPLCSVRHCLSHYLWNLQIEDFIPNFPVTVLRLLTLMLWNMYLLTDIEKFRKCISSLIKYFHHTLGVNVSPFPCGNLEEHSLRNASRKNLREKPDILYRVCKASICLKSTLYLAIFCHQLLWNAKVGK